MKRFVVQTLRQGGRSMLRTSRNTAKSMLGNLSFAGPLVFCGSETRGTSGVEESQEEIHSADSTLRKEGL